MKPTTPGEILKEEFLEPMGITTLQLSIDTGLSQREINRIIEGNLVITDTIDSVLSKYFGLSRGYWLRLQDTCTKRTFS